MVSSMLLQNQIWLHFWNPREKLLHKSGLSFAPTIMVKKLDFYFFDSDFFGVGRIFVLLSSKSQTLKNHNFLNFQYFSKKISSVNR